LSHTDDDDDKSTPRAIRVRRACGGWFIDKRTPSSRPSSTIDVSTLFTFRRHLYDSNDEDHKEDEERAWRLVERWKFNENDSLSAGPDGLDEQDCVLLDDYEPRFLRHSITLLHEQDQHNFMTDNTLSVTGPDGRMQTIIPYRQQAMPRRDAQLIH